MRSKNLSLFSLSALLLSFSNLSFSATITVNTTSELIDINGAQYIPQDPSGRSGLYNPDTLTIPDLTSSKNPSDAESGGEPAISLPEAIIAANNTPGADVIILPVGKTFTFTEPNNYWFGPNALPPITSQISILGNGGADAAPAKLGAVITRATKPMRLFFVMGPHFSTANAFFPNKVQVSLGSLTLSQLSLENGYAKGGDGSGGGAGLGGAIFNQGILGIDSSTLSGNVAQGGAGKTDNDIGGGGIAGEGILQLGGGFFEQGFIGTEANLSNNTFTSIFGADGGQYGSGGFIPTLNGNFNRNGDTSLPKCNSPRQLPALIPNCGLYGGGRSALNSTLTNHGAFGSGGGRPATLISGEDGNAGAFGSGGGYGQTGGAGGFGAGGGKGSSIGGFAGFAGGQGTITQGGGGSALGGAIFNHAGNVSIINSTISGNSVQGGNGGNGGNAYGAAIFNLNGEDVTIRLSTIYNNSCIPGAGGASECHSEALYTLGITGDGVQDGAPSPEITISNSVLANSAEELNKPQISNNLITSNASSSRLLFSGKNILRNSVSSAISTSPSASTVKTDTDILQEDPKLGPLTHNGGRSKSHLPQVDSPVLDSGDSTAALNNSTFIDQRGLARFKTKSSPASATAVVDLGSVEAGPNQPSVVTLNPNYIIADSAPIYIGRTIQISDQDTPRFTHIINLGGLATISNPSSFKLKVRLQTVGGKITFDTTDGLEVTDSSNGTDVLIKGNVHSVLNAVNGNDNNNTFPMTFTPTALSGGSSSITVTVEDLSNPSAPSTPPETIVGPIDISIIETPPTPVILGAPQKIDNSTFIVTIVFGESVYGFEEGDMQIKNAKIIPGSFKATPPGTPQTIRIGNTISKIKTIEKQTFSMNIAGTGGDISILVPAGVASDKISKDNIQSNLVTITHDIARPSISASGHPNTAGRPGTSFTMRFSFSEDVTGFTVEDIIVENATLSEFTAVDRKNYSVKVSPIGGGGVRIGIKENVAEDDIGNKNTALNTINIPLNTDGSGSAFSFIFILMFILLQLRRHNSSMRLH